MGSTGRAGPLPRVLVILGRSQPDNDLGPLLAGLAAAGARWIQYRDKESGDRDFYGRARALSEACRIAGIYPMVNDRVDVAVALACGVHLGQQDLPPAVARSQLPDEVIGLSTDRLDDLALASVDPVDYVAVGPVFATDSKADAGAPIGLEGVRAARAATERPLVAIGGIDAARAADVTLAGADAVAVLSAVSGASDPAAAFRAIHAAASSGAAARLTPPSHPA